MPAERTDGMMGSGPETNLEVRLSPLTALRPKRRLTRTIPTQPAKASGGPTADTL
jgi:hypothetical protein